MAIITVTTLDDTAVIADGEVSLREAIEAANTDASVDGSVAGSGADTIVFDPGLFGTVSLAQGHLVISSDVTIDGDSDGDGLGDITIDAQTMSRVFFVSSGTSTLDALVITGGEGGSTGGGLLVGAAADITIANSAITDNHAGDGGGLFVFGAAKLIDTTVADNSADTFGGGVGTFLGGSLEIVGSAILDNDAGALGGGIHNSGTLTLTSSSVEGNDTDGDGGGLRNSGLGVATLTNVTLSGNTALGEGGGISNENDLTLVNVTFAGNSADLGGGLFNAASSSAALSSSTLSGNFASEGGGIFNDATAADLTLINSIVLGHTVPGLDPEIHGGVTYSGVNIVGLGGDADASDGVINAAALTDVFDAVAVNGLGVNSGVLADNGGPVSTIAIKIGGTAHDAGDGAALPPADPQDLDRDGITAEALPVDARGAARVFGADLDIGAFEAGQFIVTTLDDEDYDLGSLTDETLDGDGLSLREALALANADTDANSILFDPSLAATGVLLLDALLGQLEISTDLTVDGDADGDGTRDIAVDAFGNFSRVFDVTAGTSTLRNLEIVGGDVSGENGGGIRVASVATLAVVNGLVLFNETDQSGGGIYNAGTLTVTNTSIAQNYAASGGGIATGPGSVTTLTNVTLLGNYADDSLGAGGGIYAIGATLTLVNSTLSGNSAFAGGGIVGFASNIEVISSTLSGNYAVAAGGGIASGGPGSLTLTNSIVAGNDAATDAEIALSGSGFSLTGGNIIGDELSDDGVVQQTGLELTDIFAQVGYSFYTGVRSGRLADNSGPVPTIGIKIGGAAQDAGDDAGLPDDTQDLNGNTLTTDPLPFDARGFARIAGSRVDLGALEQQPGTSFVVTTLDDELDSLDPNAAIGDFGGLGDLSLREALALAQQDRTSHDTITFSAGGTLTLTQGELAVEGNVTINGAVGGTPAVTIEGDGPLSRVFNILSGVSTLNGLTIQNGGGGVGGGVNIGSYLYDGTYADVTITNSVIRNNTALYGGGIAVGTGSSLRLINSTVSGNEADIGGGIAATYGAYLTVIGSTVSGNHTENGAFGYGGGIANQGYATLINTTVSGNTALAGGGIYNKGELTLINTTLANNVAEYAGGGLYNTACGCAVVDLYDSTISGNFAGIGGGIAHYAGDLHVINSIVAGNSAGIADADLAALGLVNFYGPNILSQGITGTPGGYTLEANLANIFHTLTVIDPTPVDGDEFDAGLLANNGGLVKTIAIVFDGAAYNTGDDGLLPPDDEDLNGNTNRIEDLPVDARGVTRVLAGDLDVGAYELQNTPPTQSANAGLTVNEGASATITAVQLLFIDNDQTAADLTFTITAAATIGTLLLNNTTVLGLGATFTQDDIDSNRVSYLHDASETTAASFGFAVSDGVGGSVAGQSFAINVTPVNDAPVNAVLTPPLSLEANHSLAITGISVLDVDAGAGSLSTTLSVVHGTLAAAALGGAIVIGSGTDTVSITGTLAAINATVAGGNVVYTPVTDYFDNDTLTMVTDDGGNTGLPGALSDTDTVAINLHTHLFGTPNDDSFILDLLPEGDIRIDALGGFGDTLTLNFRLVDATVRYVGNTIIIDGPSRHLVVTGFEQYVFTDGTVDNNDGNPLVDDLFYYARNHDVWNAHVGADEHYNVFGWHENRDPNAFFSTTTYLSANPDVAASNANPLDHWHAVGWTEGRVPSINFDPRRYLDANPDVAAAHVDPLEHYLLFGHQEGRTPFAPSELVAANGFDFVYYLNNNPDVAAANIDPFAHFMTVGWTEGRNPNALFDINGYLTNYADVDAANINPLTHFDTFGWHEGRDPSVGFDTSSYLATYPDVAAANTNPLTHFLQFGIHEGRQPFADGVWG